MSQKGNWIISEGSFQIDQNKHFEGVFATGNGYLSVRGALEEGVLEENQALEYMRLPMNVTLEKSHTMKSKWGTFVPGIVGNHPLLKEVLVNLPNMLGWNVWFNEEPLSMEQGAIHSYKRYLNMENSTLNRSFIWQTISGSEIQVEFERFISMECDHLSVQRIRMKVLKGSGTLRIKSGINGNVRTNGYNHFSSCQTFVDKDFIGVEVVTDKGCQVVQGTLIESNQPFEWSIKEEGDHIFYETEGGMEENLSYEFIKLSAVATNRDLHNQNSFETVKATLLEKAPLGYEKLLKDSESVWQQLWDRSDIKITGNDDLQKAIRFSLYHMLRSNVRKDPRVAIDAKGHAGEAYFGRYFWDTEIYLLPFFLYTNPDAARNLILYRYNTLEGAKQNARNYGYKGARFAWESGLTGEEQCPNWQYADHEIHITADVVYGLWHYFRATNDIKFLLEYGFEMLIETARYWISRVYEKEDGHYDLSGVMGPDEYSPLSKNNAFTNYLAKFNLEKSLEAAKLLKEFSSEQYTLLKNKLLLSQNELEHFERVGSGLSIPKDEARDLILQSEDFESYENIDFEEVWLDRSRPFGHFVSQEKMYRSKCLKQADVLTLMMLFPNHFTAQEMESAYNYYEPITTHDSSLSPSTHSIIASWLGMRKEAEEFFLKTVGIDLNVQKLGAADGIHIANAGGVWQSIIHGFAGVKNAIQSNILELNPILPSFAKELSFPFLWKGSRLNIQFDNEKLVVENTAECKVEIKIGNQKYTLDPMSKLETLMLTGHQVSSN
ncbi:glycosyl hydrolase family 65 protein [Neobacillus drentensis]|uniref:glycoside hydrolase family 65 protein n=1 Tax=Neobacillus drentensis TaxID=220684 RepID=UPI002FFFF3BE